MLCGFPLRVWGFGGWGGGGVHGIRLTKSRGCSGMCLAGDVSGCSSALCVPGIFFVFFFLSLSLMWQNVGDLWESRFVV